MKDKDLMSDVGGRHVTKDLQRPSRKEHVNLVDDDPDFKKTARTAAATLRRIARMIMAFENGEVEKVYEYGENSKGKPSVLVSVNWADEDNTDDKDMLAGYDLATDVFWNFENEMKKYGVKRLPDNNVDNPKGKSYLMSLNGLSIDYDLSGCTDTEAVERYLRGNGFREKK